MCVCVCVWNRERERERGRVGKERWVERRVVKRECVCAHLCVRACVRVCVCEDSNTLFYTQKRGGEKTDRQTDRETDRETDRDTERDRDIESQSLSALHARHPGSSISPHYFSTNCYPIKRSGLGNVFPSPPLSPQPSPAKCAPKSPAHTI